MKTSRRQFIGTTAAAAAAASIAPQHLMGGNNQVSPNEKINIGFVGCGTQGLRQLMDALKKPDVNIAAVCDPNRKSDDYPQWGPDELNGKIRDFIGDPDWAQNARGGLCGREVGREVVNRHYAGQKRSGEYRDCRAYEDFREMLDKEKDLDAVYIMTPEHLHGTIAVHAMRMGKHTITHKPMANVLYEARLARDTARESGVATHLFCAAGQDSTPLLCEWIWNGAIGPVREVHNWSTRPFWPQGMTERPNETSPIPDGLNWELWLGPVPHRPYNSAYTHAVFRGWYDFGTGALGDMGHYSFHQIFRILKLSYPESVEAGRSRYWSIKNFLWRKEVNLVSYPRASTIKWEFPARKDMPPVALYWYDGGLRPPIPKELETDGKSMPEEGMLFVGDKGKILADFTGANPRLIPESRMRDFKQPPKTLPRPAGELDQWLRACRGGKPSNACFESAHPFAETILLGTVALRAEQKLYWDAAKMKFKNAPEADKWLRREYRSGWEL
ncbi:MAG: Gfo/Idh/MocA family oxidoreductase [Verrucomicrobia bacterium]|nr:Gfo/Idh/MocA family oxidoreductase [Verrucomicrobiota bacterium]